MIEVESDKVWEQEQEADPHVSYVRVCVEKGVFPMKNDLLAKSNHVSALLNVAQHLKIHRNLLYYRDPQQDVNRLVVPVLARNAIIQECHEPHHC